VSGWPPLREAFRRAAEAGRPARLWLRDDDAVRVTPALERLADITSAVHVPVVLSVIPQPAEDDLGVWVQERPYLSAAVHGYAHRNHAPEGAKRQELGRYRPLAVTKAELLAGRERIAALFGAHALPMLVPPWNNIDPTLIPELPSLGFRCLSAFGPESGYARAPGLRIVNTHVDPIDWRGTRGCRPHEQLAAELLRLVQGQEPAPSAPIGVLTHHLAHDDDAWAFIERLIETAHGLARWERPD